ncbi:MAG: LamB/YcsF family protein [Frankiaceae bacterium]
MIDLNSDLGEGYGAWRLGDDEALLDVVTSANVACGFHAGDPQIMTGVVRAAAARGVAVGAQVSYADLRGFGRRPMPVTPDELYADVVYQIGALDGIARAAGIRVAYVKPHGALYNRIAGDPEQAAAVVAAIADHGGGLPLLTLPGCVAAELAAAAGLRVVGEAFADRGYTPAGRLVPRGETGALVTDVAEVVARVVRLAAEGVVRAVTGDDVPVAAESVCVHGDTPGAVALARAVRAGLADAGVGVERFA